MEKLAQAGRYLFAIAFAAFGIQHLVYAKSGAGLGAPWVLGSPLWMNVWGAALLVAGVSLLVNKTARLTSALLGALLFLYFLYFYARGIATNLRDPGGWTSGAEIFAFGGAAWVLAGTLGVTPSFIGTVARFLFAAPLIVFGVQHLMYPSFVSTLVPAWIPGNRMWPYLVGTAFLAATLSIVINVKARLAATLLGTMFFLWVLIVHLPRIVSAPGNGDEWTSGVVALAMAGGSWIVATATRKTPMTNESGR